MSYVKGSQTTHIPPFDDNELIIMRYEPFVNAALHFSLHFYCALIRAAFAGIMQPKRHLRAKGLHRTIRSDTLFAG